MPDKDLRFQEFESHPNSDVRFQFEVIKNLADSVRQLTESLRDVQKLQVDMLVRLARIEENKVHEQVAVVSGDLSKACERIAALEKDKYLRDGAMNTLGWLAKNWPLALIISALGVLIAWANGKIG